MRVVEIFRSRGLGLSHRSFSRVKVFRTSSGFELPVCRTQILAPQPLRRYYKMTATTNGEMWTAVRVRDTFLDYFKKNGHTFGGFGSQGGSQI